MNWRFLHHDAPWHDFHMVQTGHRRGAIGDIAALPAAYRRLPPSPAPNTPGTAMGKAFVNGEPWYEAHPSRDVREIYGPAFDAYDARFALWVSVLNGATMGHTYGAQGIWNWKRPGDDEEDMAGPQIGLLWHEALALEGAAHCGQAVRLLRDLPWWRLEPAPERVRQDPPPPPDYRPACARSPEELWVIYLPTGASRLTVLGLEESAWLAAWFDPCLGVNHDVGAATADETGLWAAPPAPNGADWVLLLRRE